jgi:hypothetical protein
VAIGIFEALLSVDLSPRFWYVYFMDYTYSNNIISYVLSKAMPFVLLAVLGFNLSQRFLGSGWNKKRFATFYWTCLVGAICVVLLLFVRFIIDDWMLIPVAIAAVLVAYVRRKDFFPFSARCAQCGALLSLKRIFYTDPGICKTCEAELLSAPDDTEVPK